MAFLLQLGNNVEFIAFEEEEKKMVHVYTQAFQ